MISYGNHYSITMLFGPGDVNVAHMPDEFVDVQEVILAARAYILAAIRFFH